MSVSSSGCCAANEMIRTASQGKFHIILNIRSDCEHRLRLRPVEIYMFRGPNTSLWPTYFHSNLIWKCQHSPRHFSRRTASRSITKAVKDFEGGRARGGGGRGGKEKGQERSCSLTTLSTFLWEARFTRYLGTQRVER